jgi:toxin ParE1/3/4
MIVRWTQTAQQDRDNAIDYLMAESPQSALLVDQRIDDCLPILYQHPYAGRIGRAKGTRELIVPDTSYIAVYRVEGQEILILRLLHMARRWPSTFS